MTPPSIPLLPENKRLNGYNYHAWASQISAYLNEFELYPYILQPIAVPTLQEYYQMYNYTLTRDRRDFDFELQTREYLEKRRKEVMNNRRFVYFVMWRNLEPEIQKRHLDPLYVLQPENLFSRISLRSYRHQKLPSTSTISTEKLSFSLP